MRLIPFSSANQQLGSNQIRSNTTSVNKLPYAASIVKSSEDFLKFLETNFGN